MSEITPARERKLMAICVALVVLGGALMVLGRWLGAIQ